MHRLYKITLGGCFAVATAAVDVSAGTSPAQVVSIDCRTASNNDGCEQVASCPAGTHITRAVAACNLEYGPVTREQLSAVAEGDLAVVRASDHVDEGRCWIGNTQLESGEEPIAGIRGLGAVNAGCQEHDKNGGDCHIRGVLTCE